MDYSSLAQAVFKAQNQVRTNPKSFIPKLQDMLKFFEGTLYKKPGKIPLRTNEGPAAIEGCINHLKSMNPVGELTLVDGLCKAAHDHAHDIGPKGDCSHTGSDGSSFTSRIERYGDWMGNIAESCEFGGETADEIVMNLLIDDGVPSRGHRKNMLNPNFKVVGIACCRHQGYNHCTVLDYASEFGPKGQSVWNNPSGGFGKPVFSTQGSYPSQQQGGPQQGDFRGFSNPQGFSSDVPSYSSSTYSQPTSVSFQSSTFPGDQQPFPSQKAFPSQQQGGFPSQQQGGFPSQLRETFPSQQQGGFPSQQQGGFPSQKAFPSQQQGGFPSQQQGGFPSQQQAGFPSQQFYQPQGQQGYPSTFSQGNYGQPNTQVKETFSEGPGGYSSQRVQTTQTTNYSYSSSNPGFSSGFPGFGQGGQQGGDPFTTFQTRQYGDKDLLKDPTIAQHLEKMKMQTDLSSNNLREMAKKEAPPGATGWTINSEINFVGSQKITKVTTTYDFPDGSKRQVIKEFKENA